MASSVEDDDRENTPPERPAVRGLKAYWANIKLSVKLHGKRSHTPKAPRQNDPEERNVLDERKTDRGSNIKAPTPVWTRNKVMTEYLQPGSSYRNIATRFGLGKTTVGNIINIGELSAPRVHSTVGRPREVSQKHQAVLEDIAGANPYVLDTVLMVIIKEAHPTFPNISPMTLWRCLHVYADPPFTERSTASHIHG